jgi:hypothetical protein
VTKVKILECLKGEVSLAKRGRLDVRKACSHHGAHNDFTFGSYIDISGCDFLDEISQTISC